MPSDDDDVVPGDGGPMGRGEPIADHRALFTRREFVEAFRIAGASPEIAERQTEAIQELEGDGYGIFGDLLLALALVSDDAARRVRRITGEGEEELRVRLGELRTRLPLSWPEAE